MSDHDNVFTVEFTNNLQTHPGSIILFLTFTDPPPNTYSVVWQWRPGEKNGRFVWEMHYGFMWALRGELVPGQELLFMSSRDLSPPSDNQVTLTYGEKAYLFVDPTPGPQKDALFIEQDNSVTPQIAVGLSLFGSPVCAVQAQPNTTVAFTLPATYWIAFGDFRPSLILDPAVVNQAARLPFEPSIFKIEATLNTDGSWTIVPS